MFSLLHLNVGPDRQPLKRLYVPPLLGYSQGADGAPTLAVDYSSASESLSQVAHANLEIVSSIQR